MTRRRLPALIAAVCALAVAGATASPASTGRPARGGTGGSSGRAGTVGHAGRWLVDASGRVLIPHGFNVVAKRPPYLPSATGFGDDDAAFLAGHGFTAVRLGVLVSGLSPSPGTLDRSYLDAVVAEVHLLARHGIRSLLDYHQDLWNERYQGEGFPAWMALDDGLPAAPPAGFPGNYFAMPALERVFDHFWNNDPGPGGVGLQDRLAAVEAGVAARFPGDPAVLGYDILNEPWPGSVWPSCFPPAGCPLFDRQRLDPFVARITAAVTAADPTHLVFAEPALPFDYGAPTWMQPGLPGGLAFHVYCLAAVGAPETPPTRSMCDTVEGRTVANAEAHSAATGRALLLSEFGATSDTAELSSVLSLADGHALPWLEWAYCACGDPTGSGSAEALVYDPRQPPTGANVNTVVLGRLDEPYLRAVAGTPGSGHWDPAGRILTASWSTVPPPGAAPGPGAVTEIWTSPGHFPTGYRVTVTGATVVSRPGAAVLKLLARPEATEVSVTLTPAG